MAGLPRESSFMPTIKCSNCGDAVEISMMGEHICGGGGGNPAPAPAPAPAASPGLVPPSVDTFRPLDKSIHDRIGVIPPVDTAMANRSYSRQPLTPMSFSSGSRSVSPRTPGRPSIGRADDYFDPQIANDDQNIAQSTRPGGYGGYGEIEPEPAYEATTPKKQGLSLLTRLGNIAAGPYADEPSLSPVMDRRVDNGRSGTAPPRVPRHNGYGGFGPPKKESVDANDFGGPNRSQSFPSETDEAAEAPYRTPSAPGPRPDRYNRQQSTDLNGRMGPVTTRAPPPRKSLIRPATSGGKTPNINLEAEFGSSNPYHSPSVSVSSSMSRGSSQPSDPSSSTSPARSSASRRKPSNTSAFDNLMVDIQASMEELQPKELPSRQPTSPQSNMYNDPAIQGGQPPSPPPSQWDRVDPAIQGGRPSRSPALPPSPPRAPVAKRNPAVQGSRGNCRACGDAITGKSISSADGRLSGRYHKACFVCTTCSQPFSTAEFYVHNDRPYCQYHYHKVNGSLCGSCRDGIEGQYLEDESTKKYHVDCFRCGDCRMVLRDGYFDVDGKAYCEKDAWRRLQPQTYRRSPSMSSQRSFGRSNLAPPGRPGMRGPPRPGLPMGNGRPGPPSQRGLAPSGPMPKMERRRTRLGMM